MFLFVQHLQLLFTALLLLSEKFSGRIDKEEGSCFLANTLTMALVSRINCIPNYPYMTVIEFDQGVLAEITANGDKIEYLYLDNCKLRYLPYYLFDFLPNLKWLDLR